ncbi:MAG: AzlC family ABC transporter permease [Haloarculaceae archaeon]
MRVSRSDLVDGLRDVVPLVLSELPFGVVVGAAAVEAGVPAAAAVGTSLLIYTGAAQLVAFDLLGRDAPLAVVALTALVINLRYLMYSASLAQYLRDLSRGERWTFGYLLTDPVYALTIGEFADRSTRRAARYYVGAAVPMWFAYQGGTVLGIVVGTSLPPALNVGFATPLLFLALLVPTLEDRPSLVAAGVGGSVAVGGAGLPLELGLVAGALVGIAGGLLTERGWA